MGFQDRDYSRGPRGGGGLMWFLTGSVPLFTAFGIDVRAHASLVVTIVLGLLFGVGVGFGMADKVTSMAALFTIVLLHEFGHCFACRRVGGEADQIIMHPLGGLALCAPPHRPMAHFLTSAGGPAVNVLICIVCGIILLALGAGLPVNPFTYYPIRVHASSEAAVIGIRYAYWIFAMSFSLLVFNLLPIFPLDGGQMLQAVLWPRMGYGRSMKLSTEVGMIAAAMAFAFALASGLNQLGLAVLAALGFYYCYAMRLQLMANPMSDFDEVSYAIGPDPVRRRVRRKSWLKTWREQRAKAAEVSEAAAVDQILEKVAKTGMHSLNGAEKRTLQRASEHQRKRDAAKSRR